LTSVEGSYSNPSWRCDQDALRESLERHEDDLLPVAEPPVD
jgi:hypothetical protein